VAKCTPEQLSKWLFERLKESPLQDDIPRQNLSLICDRAVHYFFNKDVLTLEGLFKWLAAEYNVPREKLAAAFSALKGPAAELGVFMRMPGDEADRTMAQTLPGDRPLSALAEESGETFGEDELPHEGADAEDHPAEDANADEDEAPVFAEEDQGEVPAPAAPSAAASAVPQARPRRHWQMLPPKPRDPVRSLSGFLTDSRYLEFVFLDYALDGNCRKEPRMQSLCSGIFQLRDEEKAFYRDPALEPGTDADTVEAWAVRLNGLALALGYAKEVAHDDQLDQAEWLRGVRQLIGIFGDLSSRILVKLSEAKKIGGDALSSFETAWSRLRYAHEALAPENERISAAAAGREVEVKTTAAAKKPAKAAAAKAVAIDTGATGLSSFVQRNQMLLVVGAGVLLLVALGYAALSMGLFGSKNVVEAKIDVSSAGLKVDKKLTDGTGLVVVVNEAEWKALSAEDKHAKLVKLYEIAKAGGLSQVQVRGPDDKILGLAMSAQMIKVFE
jgi:hypothetical protein